jgi:hypothetical protein
MPSFKPGERVVYVPLHANGNLGHPDCEQGTVVSVNDWDIVLVKFDRQVSVLGWDGTTAKGCDPMTLTHA